MRPGRGDRRRRGRGELTGDCDDVGGPRFEVGRCAGGDPPINAAPRQPVIVLATCSRTQRWASARIWFHSSLAAPPPDRRSVSDGIRPPVRTPRAGGGRRGRHLRGRRARDGRASCAPSYRGTPLGRRRSTAAPARRRGGGGRRAAADRLPPAAASASGSTDRAGWRSSAGRRRRPGFHRHGGSGRVPAETRSRHRLIPGAADRSRRSRTSRDLRALARADDPEP